MTFYSEKQIEERTTALDILAIQPPSLAILDAPADTIGMVITMSPWLSNGAEQGRDGYRSYVLKKVYKSRSSF